ncbi:unnamed protein product [Microthlaspi erraticum]|uniref:Uncharacterized protein n=1 Tax=Microthlaspi erraticum TaxID=1685480 RepID=A0A6D2IAS8_9BRAS|nr:unnamed protein product [Microthlaspi erraticum]
MMRKLSSVAMRLGRNFTYTLRETPTLHERLVWRTIETMKKLAFGSSGLVFGIGLASKVYDSRSKYVLEEEEGTRELIEQTKRIMSEQAARLKGVEERAARKGWKKVKREER